MSFWINPTGANGWYWDVLDTNHGTQVWQGLTGQFVVLANADYVAFLAAGNSPSVIDTFVNLCILIDTFNQSLTPPSYQTGTSAVLNANVSLTNTPPRVFNYTPGNTGQTIKLPQMNLFGSAPLGQKIVIFNNNSVNVFDVNLAYSDGVAIADVPILFPGEWVELAPTDNSTQAGRVVLGKKLVGYPLAAREGGTGTSTTPSPGQIPIGAAATPTYAPQTLSGDATLGSTGALSISLPGYISGLTLSNDSGAPTTTLDIATGVCCSDDGAILMRQVAGGFSKTTGSWVVGSSHGALDTGSVANATWYHVFVIERTDTGVVDVLFSTSATSPTMPTNYTKKRRIGSFLTDGSAHIVAFVQDGDVFRWDLPIADVNTVNPGTSAVTRTLTVPTGVQVYADLVVGGQNMGNSLAPAAIYVSDLALTDRAAVFPVGTVIVVSQITETLGILTNTFVVLAPAQVRTNTSAQVRSRLQISDANTTFFIETLGWTDRRGAR